MAGLVWLALVISLYYVGHKPFSPQLAMTLSRALGGTAAAFALVSAAGGLGRWLVRIQTFPLAATALQAALGLGLLSIGALVFGAVIGVGPALAWAGLIGMGFLLRGQIASWWCSWKALLDLWREGDRFGKLIACGSGLIFLSTWTVASGPPLKFDALVYHLALPEIYLESGRIVYVPQVMFWGMPQVGEMLYTWAAALAGIETAALLGWLVGGIALAGLAGALAGRLGTRAAWASIAALLSGYSLASALAWGYVDWLALLFGIGFLVALNPLGSRDLDPAHFRLAGVCAGLALGTKYTAGVLLLAGGGLAIWSLRKAGVRAMFSALLHFALPALLVSLPWWVKNLLGTGNPFYPFIYPSGAMNEFRLSFYSIPIWGGWQDAVFLPWRATISGVEGALGYSASIGPLLLALAPLAWVGMKRHAPEEHQLLVRAALIGLIGLLVWASAARLSGYLIQSRLYWAVFPALAALAGFGFKALDGLNFPGLRIGRVSGVLVLVVFFFSVIQVAAGAFELGAPQALMALKTRRAYLEENQGWYARAMEAVGELPEGSRALMLWEPRSLYCAPKCQPDEVLDRWLNELRSEQSPQEIVQTWRAQGFTHLLFYRFGADYIQQHDSRYTSNDWQALTGILSSLPNPIDFGGAYQLYALEP
jgi:hypothetical protein